MLHSVKISRAACQGCVNCIRVCPDRGDTHSRRGDKHSRRTLHRLRRMPALVPPAGARHRGGRLERGQGKSEGCDRRRPCILFPVQPLQRPVGARSGSGVDGRKSPDGRNRRGLRSVCRRHGADDSAHVAFVAAAHILLLPVGAAADSGALSGAAFQGAAHLLAARTCGGSLEDADQQPRSGHPCSLHAQRKYPWCANRRGANARRSTSQ